MKLNHSDIDLLENYWIEKSRKNFLAYRMYMRYGDFKYGWFITDLCRRLQKFYIDYLNGNRPVLIISTPPQHGKSWTVSDFITWLSGRHSELRIIFSSFSQYLGIRCNTWCQRAFESVKFNKVFPDFMFSDMNRRTTIKGLKRNSDIIEFTSGDQIGYFRNTTVGGSVTGETFDIGVIDDPVKGREEANSPVISEKTWNWYQDDFDTRASENSAQIIIMTRWSTTDLAQRIIDNDKKVQVLNYKAIATTREVNREEGEPLFPELKSLQFLEEKKRRTHQSNWEALWQGNPTITGGNIIKDNWWQWWKVLPPLKYKFITADTAQKTKNMHDYSVLQCWGVGLDKRIYLLDKIREKWESPELLKEAKIFYNKHNIKKKKVNDPVLRAMYIEDKSSGSGLIQHLSRLNIPVQEIQRSTDKVNRAMDASPFIEMGLVVLNTEINGIGNLTKEAREFPNSEFDDDIDTLVTAIEVTYINEDIYNSLQAAMEA
jgi:predicted phage terminase large subunit-like protein